MTSIKVKFRPPAAAGEAGAIYYQLIHCRRVRQIATAYRIFPSEWNQKRSAVAVPLSGERTPLILSVRECVRLETARIGKIARKFEAAGVEYSVDDIIDEFARYTREYSLFHFMQNQIDRLGRNGKIRTAETYRTTLSSFRKFRLDSDIMLDCLTTEIMEEYEAWLQNRGLSSNSISFYTRILRAVYNRAVADGIIENRSPFRKVYTGVDKTRKRALPIAMIKLIKSLDLCAFPELDYARDMFMLSFYFRGMSFIDMAYLKKSDLRDGIITYRRRKTGQCLRIAWTGEMQTTLDKYPGRPDDYLLPILGGGNANDRNIYRHKNYCINRALKKIAAKVGISDNLTLYVARHSWASAARSNGIPLSVISEGMGHDSEATTRIYLASIDTSVVDHANDVVLKSLL